MSDKQFTLYWLDGSREVVTGETIERAFTNAGYGAGAKPALDFYMDGDDTAYVWNKDKRTWDRKEPIIIVTPKPTSDEQAELDQGYSWNVEMNINPPGIKIETGFMKMPETQEDECFVTHTQLDAIAAKPYPQRSIEEQAALLRSKFNK